MTESDPKRTAQACRIYDAMLRFYPVSFQREYGDRLVLQFRDEYRNVLASGTRFSLFHFWIFILFDFMHSLLMEHQEVVVKMVKKNYFMYTAIAMGILVFLTFIFWFGPYYDMIEISFFVQLLLFPTSFMILSAITLFGIAQVTNSNVIFRLFTIFVLFTSLLFFPIPHKNPVRGTIYSTAIEYIGGNEDTAFGIVFPVYFILLLTFAILALVKKKWLPGVSLLMLCLPVLIPYVGIWLSMEIPFVIQGEGERFAVSYGVLSAIAWFVIAWWFYKEYKETSPQGVLEPA